MFRLKLFGTASIQGPDGAVTGRPVQRRRIGLLALLALARQSGVTRDKLIGYLWPDADAERARHLLSDSIYRINQAVGGEALIATGDRLELNAERLPSDAWEFADAVERGDWQRAVELHTAPFLDGFFLREADELERWVDGQRERLTRERARALEALADSAEREGAAADAVHWWRMLAGSDPYSSRIALRLMRALDRTGDRAAALQHARTHTLLLEQEMGLPPDPELLAYVAELRTPASGSRQTPQRLSTPELPQPAPQHPVRPPQSTPPQSAPAPQPAPPQSQAVSTLSASSRMGAPPRRRLAAGLLALALVIITVAAVVLSRRDDGVAESPTPAIAVLPFADLSAGGEYEYFADGMTEELIARFAHVEGIHVVGRTSVFAFKDEAIDVRDIADRLNATAVLQGSVRHSGDRLRIVAQLVDATNGYQLWTETYEREVRDVFTIQDDIAQQIVAQLRGQVAGTEAPRVPAAAGTTEDPDAFNLYLKGRYEWHRRTEQSLRAAADYFSGAVTRAPEYARAHAGLGDAYAVLGFYDFLPPREAFPAAAVAARRALELQPSLGEPHATLGYIALYYDWDWPRAEREFRRAIDLEPGYSTGHQWYANYLTAMGRFDEAVAEMGAAMELDPLSVIANAALGWVLYFSGDYERAIAQCTRALELDPDFALAHLWRAMAHEELGQYDAALAGFERAVRLSGGSAIHLALHGRALAGAGRRDEARTLLQRLEQAGQQDGSGYVPPFEMAKLHEALGDVDAALGSLEEAYEHRSHSMAFLAVDPQLRNLRTEPRFRSLVESVGLARTPGGRRLP